MRVGDIQNTLLRRVALVVIVPVLLARFVPDVIRELPDALDSAFGAFADHFRDDYSALLIKRAIGSVWSKDWKVSEVAQ